MHQTTTRARLRSARMIDRLLDDARAPRPAVRGLRSLVERDVASAAEASLVSIRDVLADESAPVSDAAAARLHTFLHDGAASPLYGSDPTAAGRAATELASAFVLPVSRQLQTAA